MVSIHTDGSCYPNPGPGGWAAIVHGLGSYEHVLRGWDAQTTNNRMELMGPIVALEHVFSHELYSGQAVMVVSDSQYVVNGITKWVHGWVRKGWKTAEGREVLNRDLWERLMAQAGSGQPLLGVVARPVAWTWIKGHNAHPVNERCDALAVGARTTRTTSTVVTPYAEVGHAR